MSPLSPALQAVLAVFKPEEGLTLAQIKAKTALPERTLRRHLQTLKNAGYLEVRGRTRQACWFLK